MKRSHTIRADFFIQRLKVGDDFKYLFFLTKRTLKFQTRGGKLKPR